MAVHDSFLTLLALRCPAVALCLRRNSLLAARDFDDDSGSSIQWLSPRASLDRAAGAEAASPSQDVAAGIDQAVVGHAITTILSQRNAGG